MHLKSREQRIKKKKIKNHILKVELNVMVMVLLAGGLVMEIRADLGQSTVDGVGCCTLKPVIWCQIYRARECRPLSPWQLGWRNEPALRFRCLRQTTYVIGDLLEILSHSESIRVMFSSKVYHSQNNSGLHDICCLSIQSQSQNYLLFLKNRLETIK